MKKILSTCVLLAAVLGASQSASAMTYAEGDLLLVLRQSGSDNIEYNLGSITNFTGLANGTTLTVTNWSSSVALSAYGGSLADVSFIFCCAAPYTSGSANNAVYLSAGVPNATPACVTASTLQQLIGKVDMIGSAAATGATAGQSYYDVSASTSSSYDAIVTSGATDAATWNGLVKFGVEAVVPGSNYVYKISASSLASKPAATQIGTFVLSASGNLVYTAGPVSTAITITAPTLEVKRAGSTVSVSFPTQSGVNYRLRSSSAVNAPLSAWTIVGNAVAGTGSTVTLTDTTSTAAFYVVEAYQ